MKKGLLIPALGLSALLASSVVMAEKGFYIGGTIGQADYDLGQNDVDDILDSSLGNFSATTSENKDTIFNLYGGYLVNKYFALELGYVDLGEVRADSTVDGSGSFNSGSAGFGIETTGFTAGIKGLMPFDNGFSLYGKAGMIRWDAEATVSNNNLSASASTDASDPYYGAGASYDLGQVRLIAEFVKYDLGGTDADVMSAGIEYRF
jgi:OOP family OmpA-OmpF porin